MSQTDPAHGDLSPMNRSTVASRYNLELIEDQYQRWRDDPKSVDETWQFFFEGYDLGRTGEGRARSDADTDASPAQAAVTRLIDAYRELGHYLADLDPLEPDAPARVARAARAVRLRPDRGRPRPHLRHQPGRPAPTPRSAS